jgi:hypothetical protein
MSGLIPKVCTLEIVGVRSVHLTEAACNFPHQMCQVRLNNGRQLGNAGGFERAK